MSIPTLKTKSFPQTKKQDAKFKIPLAFDWPQVIYTGNTADYNDPSLRNGVIGS